VSWIRPPRLAALVTGAALALCLPVICTPAAHADATASPSPSVNTGTLIDPKGNAALLNLLDEQGVTYYPVTSAANAVSDAGTDSTLVIDSAENLSGADLALLDNASFGRVILLDDDQPTLNALMPGLTVADGFASAAGPMDPACDEADAMAAGAVSFDTVSTFTPAPGTQTGCYPIQGSPSVVFADTVPTGGDAVAIGSSDFFTNADLASGGNAALALRLFGAHPNLVWLAPSFEIDPALINGGGPGGSGGAGGGGTPPNLLSLLPSWVIWVAVQLLVAALLTAYWRGRRLGAVVTEDLPVAVRAAETVEGHARLYRRAGANARAAELLRKAAAGRLAARLGLPAARAQADPATLSGPVAERLGVRPEFVHDLLAGHVPASETELVLLADHLDQLEQEVRST
jgi:hypothetical protein